MNWVWPGYIKKFLHLQFRSLVRSQADIWNTWVCTGWIGTRCGCIVWRIEMNWGVTWLYQDDFDSERHSGSFIFLVLDNRMELLIHFGRFLLLLWRIISPSKKWNAAQGVDLTHFPSFVYSMGSNIEIKVNWLSSPLYARGRLLR